MNSRPLTLALARATFTIETEPEISFLVITKTVEVVHDPVLLGDPITYTIVVANSGNGDATGVVVTDTLEPRGIGSDLNWTGVVTAGEQVEFTIPAVVTTSADFYG